MERGLGYTMLQALHSVRWCHGLAIDSSLSFGSGINGLTSHKPVCDPAVVVVSAFCVGVFLHHKSCHFLQVHTGNSAFLHPPPALSSACCMYGPTTGMFPANPPIVEKKSPKSTNIPYNSTKNPTKGHRRSMSMIPAANAAVPFSF